MAYAQVMAYAQTKGSASVQAFVRNNVKNLDQLLRESDEWAAAQKSATEHTERACDDWALFEKFAARPCSCARPGGACAWRQAGERNWTNNHPRSRILRESTTRAGDDRDRQTASQSVRDDKGVPSRDLRSR